MIAEVLVDKNPGITTVINKIDDVGNSSEFRTFAYEVLAGPDDMNVEISEGNCIFKFDYSKVYWNSRLQTEHKRLVDSFQPGEVVCDVMAGVGPFAVPAGKKGVFVWANDLNPDSVASMRDAVVRNKVSCHFNQSFFFPDSTFEDHRPNACRYSLVTRFKTSSIPSAKTATNSSTMLSPTCLL